MQLTERIQYIMKLHNLSASAFADEIDVQRSSISHVLSGRNKPSLEFIQKILKRYPKVDASWLLMGIPSQKTGESQELRDQLVRSEDPIIYGSSLFDDAMQGDSEKEVISNVPDNAVQAEKTDKKLLKLIALYSDNSFEEFLHA